MTATHAFGSDDRILDQANTLRDLPGHYESHAGGTMERRCRDRANHAPMCDAGALLFLPETPLGRDPEVSLQSLPATAATFLIKRSSGIA